MSEAPEYYDGNVFIVFEIRKVSVFTCNYTETELGNYFVLGQCSVLTSMPLWPSPIADPLSTDVRNDESAIICPDHGSLTWLL
jgi:hypothetical protein